MAPARFTPCNPKKLPKKAVLQASNVHAHFPFKHVRATMKSYDLGVANNNIGGLLYALNVVEGCGSLTMSFMSETDQKVWTVGTPKRGLEKCCKQSVANKKYLEATHKYFCFFFKPCIYPEVLATMQVTASVGATPVMCRTDAFRGCTNHYILPHGERLQFASASISRFPLFGGLVLGQFVHNLCRITNVRVCV